MNIAHMLIACCMFHGTRSLTEETFSSPPITDTLLSYSTSASLFFSNLYENTKISLQKYTAKIQLVWSQWKHNKIFHACISTTFIALILFAFVRFLSYREEARLKKLIADILENGNHSCDLLQEIKEAAKKRNQTAQELFSSFGYSLAQLPSQLPLTKTLSSLLSVLEQSEQLTQEKIDSITINTNTLFNDDQINKMITENGVQNKNTMTTLSSIAQNNGTQLLTQKDLVSELDEKCQALSIQITTLKTILNEEK